MFHFLSMHDQKWNLGYGVRCSSLAKQILSTCEALGFTFSTKKEKKLEAFQKQQSTFCCVPSIVPHPHSRGFLRLRTASLWHPLRCLASTPGSVSVNGNYVSVIYLLFVYHLPT